MINITETKTGRRWAAVSQRLGKLQQTAQTALGQRASLASGFGERVSERPVPLSFTAQAFTEVLQAVPGVGSSTQVAENIRDSLRVSEHAVQAYLATSGEGDSIKVVISLDPSPIIVISRVTRNRRLDAELVCGPRNTSIQEIEILTGSREGLPTRYDGRIAFNLAGQVTDAVEAGWLTGPQGDLIWLGDHLPERVDLADLFSRITAPDDLNQPLTLSSLVNR